MREIIGENMSMPISDLGITATLAYSGNNGFWRPLEVWEMSDEEYNRLCDLTNKITDDEWYDKYNGSWWCGAEGSIMGMPDEEFVINGAKIYAWRNEYKDEDLLREWNEMKESDKEWYDGYEGYRDTWYPYEYKNICEYFCEVLGASTEKNVCALATDLAKYNNMTVAELFRQYGNKSVT